MIREYQESGLASGVHGWDARLKLGLLVAAVAANVVIANLWLSLALFVVAVVLVFLSAVPLRLFLIFFLAPAWATLLVFAGFSVGFGSTPVADIGLLTIYREGIVLGLAAAARVASDMSWMALVFLTTSFSAILSALRWYRIPEILVDALGMAYRYAFLLIDEFHRMISTARIKGGLRSGVERLRTTGMILSQVLMRAYDRASSIQQAMISRGACASPMATEKTRSNDPAQSGSAEATGFGLLGALTPDGEADVLEASKLRFSYLRDSTPEIDDVSLRVARGEIVFLCGSNGSGKSTLLKLIAGILRPAAGQIRLSGTPLDRSTRNDAFHRVGLLFQDPDDQVFCPTVAEDVAFGPRNMGLGEEEIARVVAQAMELTEIGYLAQRPIHRLSYGEMKRIGLAGLLAMRSPLLLLDEPRAFLDPRSAHRFVDLVRRLNRELGYTFIIVTHDMDFAAQLASRVVVLDHGRVVADDVPRKILTDPELLARSRLEPPLLTRVFAGVEPAALGGREIPLTAQEAIELLAAAASGQKPDSGPG